VVGAVDERLQEDDAMPNNKALTPISNFAISPSLRFGRVQADELAPSNGLAFSRQLAMALDESALRRGYAEQS